MSIANLSSSSLNLYRNSFHETRESSLASPSTIGEQLHEFRHSSSFVRATPHTKLCGSHRVGPYLVRRPSNHREMCGNPTGQCATEGYQLLHVIQTVTLIFFVGHCTREVIRSIKTFNDKRHTLWHLIKRYIVLCFVVSPFFKCFSYLKKARNSPNCSCTSHNSLRKTTSTKADQFQ